jgi:hypothetical protein
MTLSIMALDVECCYAESRDLFIVMLNIFMLSVVMLNVVAPDIEEGVSFLKFVFIPDSVC